LERHLKSAGRVIDRGVGYLAERSLRWACSWLACGRPLATNREPRPPIYTGFWTPPAARRLYFS